MKKKAIKKPEKWKPKYRWIESISIDLKTGKEKFKYLVPKTPEEEEKLETEFNRKMRGVLDILLNEVNKNSGTKLKNGL